MNINKKSWHYKLYSWTYDAWDRSYTPERSNLCQYFQRIVWMGFFTFLWSAILSIGYVLVATPVLLLFGLRPVNVWEDHIISTQQLCEKYQGLKIGSFRLYPWQVLLPSVFLFLEWLWFHYASHWYYPLGVQLSIIEIFAFSIFFYEVSDNETVVIARNFLSAKKQGICPLVEFNDEPTSKDIT